LVEELDSGIGALEMDLMIGMNPEGTFGCPRGGYITAIAVGVSNSLVCFL
jgi:hypothetical protein